MWVKWAIPVIGSILILGTLLLFQDAEAVSTVEFLTCAPTAIQANPGFPTCDLQTGIAQNSLTATPPTGLLAVLEPDTVEHTSQWKSAPLAAPQTLLTGSITLDLVMMNHAENSNDQDICWSKHVILPNNAGEITLVAPHCFENPLPANPQICPFGAIGAGISANCLALASLVSETVPSLLLTPTVIPAGSVIELNVFCPGSSFLGIFFNKGIDVDGDGTLEFSKLTERTSDVIGGTLVPIDTTTLLLAGAQSISLWMIPVVAAGIGIAVFVINRRK